MDRLSVATGDRGFLTTLWGAAQRRILKAVGGDTFGLYTGGGSRYSSRGLANSQGNVDEMFKAFRSVVFACIHIRAKEVANKAEFNARLRTGPKKFRDLPYSHPLSTLLANPNPYLTPYFYWYSMIAYLDISGDSYSWISRDKMKVPRALWPLHPKQVKIVPGDRSKNEPIIKGYTVRWDGATETFVPEEDMLHLRHPNPDDLYFHGNSLVMRAAYEIDIHEFIMQFQKVFFENYAMPAFMLLYPDTMDEDVRKRFVEQWDEKYRSNPGKFYLAEGAKDAKLDVMGQQEEMNYLQSRGVNITSILGIFGVPPSKLMITENLEARATTDSMNYLFHLETIDPLLTMIEQQLTTDLAIQIFGDERLVVQHTPTIPTDAKTQAEIDNLQLAGKTRFINELRERDGLEPVEGGDEPLGTALEVPLSQIFRGIEPDPTPDRGARGSHEVPEDDATDEDLPPGKRLSMRSRALHLGAASGELTEGQKTAIWKAADRIRNRWEIKVAREVKAWYNGIRNAVRTNLEDKQELSLKAHEPASAAPFMFDVEEWLRKLQPIMQTQTLAILRDSFERFVQQYGVNGLIFAPNTPLVQEALAAVNSKTVTVPQTLHDDLLSALDEGIRLQETPELLSRRVSRFFDDVVDYRSNRIARTVSNYGVNRGGRIAATDAGLNVKTWLTQRDGRVRDTHAAIDGARVGIHEKFRLPNGDQLDVPGDPTGAPEDTINCRCTAFFSKTSEGNT